MAENLNISPDMIDNLVKMLKNSGINDSSNSNVNHENIENSNNSSNNIDFETIVKMKSILDNINNSSNQDSNLLYSLKPYLRKSRQAKLDQYINILKISQVSKLFSNKGDDN